MRSSILVETSARHVHLTSEQVEILFGKGHTLTVKKMLSQPGQFASEEKVDVVGPKNTLRNVSVLGPVRKAAQVEVSLTDARTLGISGTPGIKITGPCGEIEISEGVIAAQRHIHLTPAEAAEFGVSDKEVVKVKLDTARPLIFDGVVVRVREDFSAAMHIDTDESNAACAYGEVYGEIIKN